MTYEFAPAFSYYNISAGLGSNLNLNDAGEKNAITTLTSTVRGLPFPFKFYGQIYDSITICSNGWCAFGNQAWNDNFRNYQIPAMQAPQAMIAPYWQDLCTSGGGGVWTYASADSHTFVIQWKAAQMSTSGSCGSISLDFEVILRDPSFYPTDDGNGQVLVQYLAASTSTTDISREVEGCGVGIQDARGTTGLAYYNQYPGYSPGAAAIAANRAILFTTEALILRGTLDGQIRDSANAEALMGAVVTLAGTDHTVTTDATGHYHLDHVLVGAYDVDVTRPGYNPLRVTNVLVFNDSTSVLDLSLLHPEMVLSADTLSAQTLTDPIAIPFTLSNPGNGPLDYTTALLYGGDPSEDPCDSVGAIATSTVTGDFQMWGCEFLGGSWWVTGGSGPSGQNVIYQFDRYGNPQGHIPQVSTTSFGWFDLATDGQRLYGSDGALILGIDPLGVLPTDTIPGPLNPCRALAYDPASDHFWVAEYGEDVYEIDREGNIINQFENAAPTELSITGLAWNADDPDGFKLYIVSQNGSTLARLTRMNPFTGQRVLLKDLAAAPGDRSAGFAITSGWNSTLLVCASVLQNTNGDYMQIYELAFDHSWIDLAPLGNAIEPGEQRDLTLTLNPAGLADGFYYTDIRFYSAIMGVSIVLPVQFIVGTPNTSEAGGHHAAHGVSSSPELPQSLQSHHHHSLRTEE